MTTFNTFWKIVKKYKGTIILYTVILIAFGGINIKNNDITKTFESELPDIAIVNKDSKQIARTKFPGQPCRKHTRKLAQRYVLPLLDTPHHSSGTHRHPQ